MNIVFAGFGGQGVLTAGLIVANIAIRSGLEVLWMPAYGGQMRGGKSYSLVKFDKEPICHPDIENLDVLVAMNRPSLEGFAGFVKPGGLILINSDTVGNEVAADYPNLKAIRAPFATAAKEVQNLKGANIAALGMMASLTGVFSETDFKEGMKDYFDSKGKAKFSQLNEAAFDAGYKMAEEFKC